MIGVEVILRHLPAGLFRELMLPLVFPVELEPTREEGYIRKDKVDVYLIATPYREMHW